MVFDFRERCANLVPGHTVTFDSEFKCIVGSRQSNIVFLVSYKKAHGVEGKFKLGRRANEARPNRFFDSLPSELNCQELIIIVCCRFVATSRLDITSVIKVAGLFFQVELNPVVEARNLAVLRNKSSSYCMSISLHKKQ